MLHNSPFHRLAQDHTALICNMNLHLLRGILAEVADTGLRAALPTDDDSCSRVPQLMGT